MPPTSQKRYSVEHPFAAPAAASTTQRRQQQRSNSPRRASSGAHDLTNSDAQRRPDARINTATLTTRQPWHQSRHIDRILHLLTTTITIAGILKEINVL